MLKTDSKQAKENIKKYIFEHFNSEVCNFCGDKNDFSAVAVAIFDDFERNYCRAQAAYFLRQNMSHFEIFADWCAGLPSVLDTCYYPFRC